MKAKAVLAILLCYVFFTTQSYAISGGPPTGGGGTTSVNVVGTYSGVLTGLLDKDPNTGVTSVSDSLALFSMNVPTTGLTTGTALVFAGGRIFTGTINAAVDPNSGSIRALIATSFSFTFTSSVLRDNNGNFVQVQVTANSTGKMKATIAASSAASSVATFPQTLVLARITGTATLNSDTGGVDESLTANRYSPIVTRITTYTVDGFKQQEITSAAALVTASTGSTTTGGSSRTGG
ncbi:MAG: hypothetical protein JO117_06020 [Verrucomicrobia bacterium]|nr:hypothetical protein [Verrucomicrobiota bacterium]